MKDVSNRKLKSFWTQDGTDFVANIGIMKKAIVVRKYRETFGCYYSISICSYFPFTDAQYKIKFDNYFDACELAENHLKHWIESIFMADFNKLDSDLNSEKLIC